MSLVNKWKPTKLLKNIDDKNKSNAAKSLEEAYKASINIAKERSDEDAEELKIGEINVPENVQKITTISLPAISRIYSDSDADEVDGEKVVREVASMVDRYEKENLDGPPLNHIEDVDEEAELLSLFVENYIQM